MFWLISNTVQIQVECQGSFAICVVCANSARFAACTTQLRLTEAAQSNGVRVASVSKRAAVATSLPRKDFKPIQRTGNKLGRAS